MGLIEKLGTQFRKPSGLIGRIMGHWMNWQHSRLTKWAIQLMDVRPDDHVLDIGCGGGIAIKRIAKIAVDGVVAGVDYSEIMVQQALQCNAATVRAGRMTVKPGSISALPYEDESFDKVYAHEPLQYGQITIKGSRLSTSELCQKACRQFRRRRISTKEGLEVAQHPLGLL